MCVRKNQIGWNVGLAGNSGNWIIGGMEMERKGFGRDCVTVSAGCGMWGDREQKIEQRKRTNL